MMGLRGCRVGIMMPGVTEMQVRAIFQAGCRQAKKGIKVHAEVMIPLVTHVNELRLEREKLEKVAKQVMEEEGIEIDYKFGTMIETPRAALTADELAEYAQFFSFGTNDLTQMTFGFSRDDAEGKFLLKYVERKILPENPFQSLDQIGRGQAGGYGRRGRQGHAARYRAGHLRRARRRSRLDRLFPSRRAKVRQLLPLPRAGGSPGCGAGGDSQQVTRDSISPRSH